MIIYIYEIIILYLYGSILFVQLNNI